MDVTHVHSDRALLIDEIRVAGSMVSDDGGVPPLDTDTPLDTLGLDSVQVAELFCVLEERLGLWLDPQAYLGATTVGDVMAILEQAYGTRVST